MKNQGDEVALYEASQEYSKSEFAERNREHIRLSQLFDDVCWMAINLRERSGVKDGVIRFIVKESCV